ARSPPGLLLVMHTNPLPPPWANECRYLLSSTTRHCVSRPVLYPTYMLAGGTLLPNLAPAVCRVYNDWILDDYCAGSGGRLIPVATLPLTDVDAAVAEVRRVAERGFQAGFVRPNPRPGTKYTA